VDALGFEKGSTFRPDPAMSGDRFRGPTRVVRALALLAALGFIVAYLAVVQARIDYPFEIEWMEGGSSGHVARILAGESLYGPPTLAFTPFIYTPLYFHLGAWLSPVLGEGFFSLRLISCLASLACFALVAAFVQREVHDWAAAWLAAGVFAATFRISGAWFDIARVDSLFLFFTLAALHPLRFGSGWRAGALAGALAACAFFTKQTALPIFAAFALCAVFERNAKWSVFFGVFAGLVVLVGLALNVASDGWFAYYVFELPGQHQARWNKLGEFWLRSMLVRVPVLAAAAIALFALDRSPGAASRRLFYACLAIGTLGTSMFSRVHSGGYLNVLMPAYAGLAILFGLGVAALLSENRVKRRPWLPLVVFGLCLVQLGMLRYDVSRQIPSERDRRAGERVVEIIRGFDGEVLVPYHGYLPELAGKSGSGQWMAIADVLRGDEGRLEEALETEIRDAIITRRFDAIIVDRDDWYAQELATAYELSEDLFDDRGTFMTRTGDRMRPEKVFVPRRAVAQ
jgi:hypothetical protein